MARAMDGLASLAPGEIHVWRIDLDATPRLREGMPSPEEAARAARFAFDRDRNRYLRARRALRLLLGGYLGRDPGALEFESGENGKPALRDGGVLAFNASHAEGIALVAVAQGRAVGIDAEIRRPRENLPALAAAVFDDVERAGFETLGDAERLGRFLVGWTRKEAVLKALGVGLTVDPARVRVGLRRERLRVALPSLPGPEATCDVETIVDEPGLVASIAAPAGWDRLRCREFPREDAPR